MPLDLVGSRLAQKSQGGFWPNYMDLEGCETERKMVSKSLPGGRRPAYKISSLNEAYHLFI